MNNKQRNSTARNQTDFKNMRKKLLEDDPTCTICGQEANTIDHIIPVDQFPNPKDANYPDNLRVLCKSCNSRLGARYVNAKTAGRIQGHDHSERSEFLDERRSVTPKDSHSVSAPYGVRVSRDEVQNILHYPRLRTNTQGGDQRYLDEVVQLARDVLKIELMDWQKLVLGDQLSLDENGRLMFRQSVVSVARQNGKSLALRCLLLWWLVKMPEHRGERQTVLSTAHRLDLASELFNSLAGILEEYFDAKVIYSYGRQSVEIPASADGSFPGSRWIVRAATPSAGHGLSVDLLIVDELFGCSPESVDDALVPTMRARRDPLMSCWSTAGTVDESIVFRRMREKGIAEIDTGKRSRLYYAEYSPPSDLDPMSPEAWQYANPALGTTLEMETIEDESKGSNQNAFLRASVNLWIASHRSWIDPGHYVQLGDAGELPEEGGWLAIEASQDDQRFVGVRSVEVGDKVLTTVEFIVETLRELWAETENSKKRHKGMQIAVGAALDIHLPQSLKASALLVGTRELQKWTTVVRSMIVSGQTRHTGEELLVEQVNRAVLVKHQGHMSLSSARSPGPIELCRAMVWSVALAGKPKSQTRVAYAFSS